MSSVKQCSMPNCDKPQRAGQRYCSGCHKVYMRAWRARRKREAEQMKDTVIRLRKRVVELEQENAELRT